MANNKKMVEAITGRDEDFAKWYTDIVKKAELIDYSSVKGCMVFRPYGYAIWENIQADMDKRFKKTGVENVYMPMFIPESLLQREKDHVEGFAPECAWVTVGGQEKLAERLCVRPTSETLFCEHYKKVVETYRDLPKLYNQWCSVVRWEKTTRPFLRNSEFLWQEGHTIHETAGRDNKLHYPHQTSWGVSTRMIGAIIMVHGDDDGLVLPPKISPIQVVILPIAMHKEGVLEKANELKASLEDKFRVKLDDSDHAPGWKFAEYEMKGVPVRVEIGPKDIEKGQCVVVRRDTREKIFTPIENLSETIEKTLQEIHDAMYERALKNMQEKTHVALTHDEFLQLGKEQGGFIKAMWCGDSECEDILKDETGGVKSRCIPFEEEHLSDVCVCCGKPAKHMVYWGKQY